MADFRPFSPRWGDISFTEAPQTTARCYAGVIFLSYSPSGRHREPAGVEGAGVSGGPGRGAGGRRQGQGGPRDDAPHLSAHQAPLLWRVPEYPEGLAAVPVGGGGAWPGFGTTAHQVPPVWRAPEGPEGTGGLRDRHFRAFRLACGDLAGGRALRRLEHQRRRKQQQPGYAKGAGTEVPAPYRLTQPLPRRGSGRMILSPGDGDASTGTCRPRRPLPGPLRRSGRRSRCGRGPSSAWWPGHRARRNRSSRR